MLRHCCGKWSLGGKAVVLDAVACLLFNVGDWRIDVLALVMLRRVCSDNPLMQRSFL
jgi:hypothetical protein